MRVDTNRKGYYKIQSAGMELPDNYTSSRTAIDAAINLWLAGSDDVVVVQPCIEVTGSRSEHKAESIEHSIIIEAEG